MADQHHRAVEIVERLQQLVARVDVEMVGRLVEDQQIGLVERRQRQHQPRPLAARQIADLGQLLVGGEAEAAQLRAHLLHGQLGPQALQASRSA